MFPKRYLLKFLKKWLAVKMNDSRNMKIPEHIAIILDGNRRYAEKKGLPRIKGHEFGAENVKNLFEWCRELEIKQITLYTFSTENFNRDKEEVEYLIVLLKNYFKKINFKKLNEMGGRINFIGRLSLFSNELQNIFKDVSDKTMQNDKFIVNFAIGYGGRAEIVDAVKSIIKDVTDGELSEVSINEETIRNRLYIKSEPEILIRPGGEKRLSNFLLWQTSYSELFFIDKLWPEFTKEDLMEIIKEYNQRERKFGK